MEEKDEQLPSDGDQSKAAFPGPSVFQRFETGRLRACGAGVGLAGSVGQMLGGGNVPRNTKALVKTLERRQSDLEGRIGRIERARIDLGLAEKDSIHASCTAFSLLAGSSATLEEVETLYKSLPQQLEELQTILTARLSKVQSLLESVRGAVPKFLDDLLSELQNVDW